MKAAALSRLAVILILFILIGTAGAQDADRVDPFQPMPSAALILSPGKQGSAVVFDYGERLLLTNHHVAAAGQNIEAIFAIWADDGRVLISRELYLKKGQRIAGKCLASDAERDLAILQLSSIPAKVGEVKMAKETLKLEDRVYMMGNPGNSKQVWVNSQGKVTALGDRLLEFKNGPPVKARILELISEDRKIGPGASGGPTVNTKGELVGVIQSMSSARSFNCVDILVVRGFISEFFRKQGSAAIAKQDYNEAIARLTKAVGINPGDALAYHERAAGNSFQRHFDEAIADYSAAIQIDAKLSRSWRGRASVYYNTGKYTNAVADCTEAIKIDPGYALAYLSRSRAYEKLGQAGLARADYEIAVKIDPKLK